METDSAGTGGSAREIRKVAAMRDLQILNERSQAEDVEKRLKIRARVQKILKLERYKSHTF